MRKLKVALVHDYLVTFGGAERVLLALHEIWPEAPVYLALVDPKALGKHWAYFKGWDLRPSWFQKIPGARKLISPLRFLLPLVWESFDFSAYDLVISSSAWAIPKGIIAKPDTLHICYCHTPPRFLYYYPGARPWQKYWPVRVYAAVVNHFLRFWDYLSSQRVDYFLANSQEVAARIKKFYRREAVVIPPPVIQKLPTTNIQAPTTVQQSFYLYVSRLVAYKHPELAIKACQQLGRKLVIVGDGPMRKQVEALAQQEGKINYLGRISDRKLWQLYQRCRAVIFPVEQEDFGIVPLEAAAFGKPTIAYYSGGAKETVLEGKTGLFFRQLTVESLVAAIKKLEATSFSAADCRRWARKFSETQFKTQILALVEKLMAQREEERASRVS